MKLPVPVNIITGGLGTGKTTAVSHLLRCKAQTAPSETWAVLVNEFGALGIDASLLQGPVPALPAGGQPQPLGRVVVRELAGGCMCCSLSGPMGAAIAQLVRTAKPDRLIIEPSGLGHPAGLLDVLQGEHLRSALLLRAVICLVDCRQARDPQLAASEVYQDQVNVADILVGTKADLATEDEVHAFQALAAELFPPKSRVLTASHGALDPSLLDEPRQPSFQPWFPEAHAGSRRRAQRQQQERKAGSIGQAQLSASKAWEAGGPSPEPQPQQPQSADEGSPEEAPGDVEDQAGGWQQQQAQEAWAAGLPARFISEGSPTHLACGWLFPPDRIFDPSRLKRLLDAVAGAGVGAEAAAAGGTGTRSGSGGVARLKGVFRVSKSSWVAVQLDTAVNDGAGADSSGPKGRTQLLPVAYRKDSRLEVILARGHAHAGGSIVGAAPAQRLESAASGMDALSICGSGVQGSESQGEGAADAGAGGAGDKARSSPAGGGGGVQASAGADAEDAGAEVKGAVRALLRQEWHVFEACLCACARPV